MSSPPEAPAGRLRRVSSVVARLRVPGLVAIGYLLLAVWVVHPLWVDPAGRYPATNTSDPEFFDQVLVHATRIFTHGENPLFTPMFNAPLGVNLVANTGMLALAVPLVPVTLVFGPAVAFTLTITLGLAGTAIAWFVVLSRRVVRWVPAAVVGGLFCGFAPGMINHANGHPNLVAQFLLPFIVSECLELARGGGPVRLGAPATRDGSARWRRGLVLGVLIALQALINEELLFFTALALAVFCLCYAAFAPAVARAAWRPMLVGLGVAALTAGALLAYPLWWQFLGPQHYRGLPAFARGLHADLASYPAFPKLSLMRGSGRLSAQPEENTFLGVPLLLALPLIVGWLWRRPLARALTVVGVAFAVGSWGVDVTRNGKVVWANGPWNWLAHWPPFDDVVPVRLGLVLIPIIGVLLALLLDDARLLRRPDRYAWFAIVAVAIVPIAPLPLPVVNRAPVPHFFTGGRWHEFVHSGQSVLNADGSVWNGGLHAMGWSTATGQGFRVVGGYFLGPDAAGVGQFGPQYRLTNALLSDVAAGSPVPVIGPAERDELVADARYWNLALIVLTDDAPNRDRLDLMLTELVGPGRRVDDVDVWDVRALR